MPNLNEFFNKTSEDAKPAMFETLDGVRPCSKCDEDVEGAFWNPLDRVMLWKCSRGHETLFRVN